MWIYVIPPTNDDVMMYDFLKHYEIPVIVIATKADKIPKGKMAKAFEGCQGDAGH
ncbi:hypothetical protein GCM10020331_034680 [Ectobacillus funiculus]